LPELIALEVRSQLVGLRTATDRFEELLLRYGAPVVIGSMTRMIDVTARTVAERLSRLPDATWTDERYISGTGVADSRLFTLRLSYTKSGDRLLASNRGTAPSVGALNTPPGMFRAAVMAGLLPVLAHDQFLCAAGLLRQLDFDYERGAINSARHPASVASSIGSVSTTNQAQVLAAKMVSGDPDLAAHAFASCTLHTLTSTGMAWMNDDGTVNLDGFNDLMSGGIGGFNHRDGMDYGGSVLAVAHRFSDVERFELAMPMLYLYRRAVPWSGGHGRWRGGSNYVAAYVGTRAESAEVYGGGLRQSVTMGHGVCGGFPASGGYFWYAGDTSVQSCFAEGRLPEGPGDLRDLAPHGSLVIAPRLRLCRDDVFEYLANPGAGWGDPLDREPMLVVADSRSGRVSLADAREVYGVAIGEDGSLDDKGTDALRRQLREIRLATAQPGRVSLSATADTNGSVRIIEGVALVSSDGTNHFACGHCGRLLTSATESYRGGCMTLRTRLADLSPLFASQPTDIGAELILRQFVCPGCATILDSQLCLPDDEPYDDVRLGRH
jgi:N-methylhydantoinase B